MTQITPVGEVFLNLRQAADRLGITVSDAEDLVRSNALESRIFVTASSVEYLRRGSDD